MALPRIAVIGTGGTISSLGASSLDVLDYPDFGQKLSCEALLDRFPETRLVADPVPVTFRQVGSTAIGPTDWIELRGLIHRLAHEDPAFAGFVIPHGTATLEETAFFLNLTLGVSPAGGARRGAAPGERARHRCRDEPGQRVAGRRLARGARQGRARRAQRRNPARRATSSRPRPTGCRPSARSISARSAMSTATACISIARRCRRICPIRRSLRSISPSLPRVDIIYSYAGADGELVDAAVAAGARGLVSAGFAPGSPTPEQRAAFERAAKSGIVVVQCSRAASGRVAPRRRLRETGIVAGEDLSPQKARILLMLALSTTTDIAAIQEAFSTY